MDDVFFDIAMELAGGLHIASPKCDTAAAAPDQQQSTSATSPRKTSSHSQPQPIATEDISSEAVPKTVVKEFAVEGAASELKESSIEGQMSNKLDLITTAPSKLGSKSKPEEDPWNSWAWPSSKRSKQKTKKNTMLWEEEPVTA